MQLKVTTYNFRADEFASIKFQNRLKWTDLIETVVINGQIGFRLLRKYRESTSSRSANRRFISWVSIIQ